jgi:hypothetical protein
MGHTGPHATHYRNAGTWVAGVQWTRQRPRYIPPMTALLVSLSTTTIIEVTHDALVTFNGGDTGWMMAGAVATGLAYLALWVWAHNHR